MYNFNANECKNRCVEWIREWFYKNGKGCNAIIGISGGKDSSIVAALCVEALGKDRVIGVLMPNDVQSDIDKSLELVNFLKIKHMTINIGAMFFALTKQLELCLDKISTQTRTNIPPRLRMTTLYAVSQSNNGRVANTCNLSEDYIGYATKYGDSAGDFAPLAELTVTEVKQIGYALGLPIDLIEKAPSDGLCGKTDEDNLGFTYNELDKYIRTGEINDLTIKAKIDDLHNKNLFKMQLMQSFTL